MALVFLSPRITPLAPNADEEPNSAHNAHDSLMRAAELLVLAYFTTLLVVASLQRRRREMWKRAAALAIAGAVIVSIGVLLPDGDPGGLLGGLLGGLSLRDWWPLLTLPLAYWAPAPLAGVPATGLERLLAAVDRRWPLLTRADGRPRRTADAALEFAYLLVYPMVPAGLLAVGWTGDRDTIDAFWPALFVSVLPCYAMLAALPTRTPRDLHANPLPQEPGVRMLNVVFLQTFGNRWNTFPSGHAAGAAAIAVLVARAGSPSAWAFALLALGIALGTVRGRYHYLLDTALGVMLGVVAAAIQL